MKFSNLTKEEQVEQLKELGAALSNAAKDAITKYRGLEAELKIGVIGADLAEPFHAIEAFRTAIAEGYGVILVDDERGGKCFAHKQQSGIPNSLHRCQSIAPVNIEPFEDTCSKNYLRNYPIKRKKI